MEIALTLKTGCELTIVAKTTLNRNLHAMHDAGKFTHKLVTDIISQIFAHFDRQQLLEYFEEGEKADENIKIMIYNLPEKRKETVLAILRQNIESLK